MFYLPQKTQFGELKIKEVFEFYDIPCLFTCKNKAGQHYLVLSIDESEQYLEWLYLEVSMYRLNVHLKTKKMDLYSAFKRPENGFLYNVKTYLSSNSVELERIFPEQLTDDDLPYKNTYLTSKEPEPERVSSDAFYHLAVS